jgi:hypothetical protein
MNIPEKAILVRRALIGAYNMDYDVFCKVMGHLDDYYAREKWTLMQRNFTKWYCELDSEHTKMFMSYIEGVR